MTTSTCYDSGWCGLIPIEEPTGFDDGTDGILTRQSSIADNDKPELKTRTTTEDDDKAPQTDDKQPEQTTAPGRSSTRPSTVAATPTLTFDPTQTATRSGDVETAVPTAAAASGGGGGSGGVSKGAAAGIAIATAIIGGAIAFFIAVMLFKRRRRPPAHGYSDSSTNFISSMKGEHPSYVQVSQTGPPPIVAAAIPASKRNTLNLSDLSNSSDFLAGTLPPAADEQTVKNKVTTLFNQIQQHVDDFYRDIHATLTPSMENDLKKFGDGSVNLAEELELSSTPTIAIKHALVGYILGIVAPEADQQSTLFPVEVAGLKENERSADSPDDQAAYILYRRLAVFLHSPTTSSLQSRQSDIREAAEHFALTFFPWANPAYADQDKDENLVDVINNALDLSVWLFGQPFLYEFVWEGVGRRGTLVAPGLQKCTDERGRPMERPKTVVESVVVAG
ncbi:hypothetical protein N0V90_005436 [Kalmusia sp. IMI 367209]|nr:hypothetical protein N0V90_005436 [Kalmusia sp. IMI 367209]